VVSRSGDSALLVPARVAVRRAVDAARIGPAAEGAIVGQPASHRPRRSARRPPREHGIPVVVATGAATARLHNGQVVTVDGGAGVVEVVP
jgi:hypothetical protein